MTEGTASAPARRVFHPGRRATKVARLLLVGLVVSTAWPALASDDEDAHRPASRRVQAVREWATKRLEECFEALDRNDYVAARQPLDDMRHRKGRLNDHEEAVMWQAYGYVFAGQEQYQNAARALELALSLDALGESQSMSTRFDLGQLYMLTEQWDKAITTLVDWYERSEDPPANAEYVVALALAQRERWKEALPYARRAVDKSDPPRESWLQLLLQIHFAQDEKQEMLPVLEQMIELYPKKEHWLRLYGLFNELGEEDKALAALEVAYTDGLLDRANELVDLARLYAYHELPYSSAMVLEKGIADGTIDPDHDVWDLLANSWLQAREYDKALEPLARAASSDDDGESYVRLAQVYIEREDWSDARQALDQALEKGGLTDPGRAHLLLGIAHFGDSQPMAARSEFQRAQQYDRTRDVATKWLQHVSQREKARQPTSPS